MWAIVCDPILRGMEARIPPTLGRPTCHAHNVAVAVRHIVRVLFCCACLVCLWGSGRVGVAAERPQDCDRQVCGHGRQRGAVLGCRGVAPAAMHSLSACCVFWLRHRAERRGAPLGHRRTQIRSARPPDSRHGGGGGVRHQHLEVHCTACRVKRGLTVLGDGLSCQAHFGRRTRCVSSGSWRSSWLGLSCRM